MEPLARRFLHHFTLLSDKLGSTKQLIAPFSARAASRRVLRPDRLRHVTPTFNPPGTSFPQNCSDCRSSTTIYVERKRGFGGRSSLSQLYGIALCTVSYLNGDVQCLPIVARLERIDTDGEHAAQAPRQDKSAVMHNLMYDVEYVKWRT